MKVFMITSAGRRSSSGNQATATRWRKILKLLGHQVTVNDDWDGSDTDMIVALNAWRSADMIRAFRKRYPNRPLILALTGTDLYRFIHSHPAETLGAIESADQLVALHDLAHQAIPKKYWKKFRVIKQSAIPVKRKPPRSRTFDLCVSGHLRDEKDSLRAAYAARHLPENSQIRILHYGRPHNEKWGKMARDEMQINPRYRWFGEVPHWKIRQVHARSRAMVLSSRMEGGANVVSEAIMADLPVLASKINGSVGLLGKDYQGYYPVEDTDALRQLMLKAERDNGFLPMLTRQQQSLKNDFTEEAEFAGWQHLLEQIWSFSKYR